MEHNESLKPFINISDFGGEPFIFVCPVCNGDFVHISQVLVMTKKTITSVSSKGTRVIEEEHPYVHRGSVTVFRIYCEQCGVQKDVLFRFHKGQTFVDVVEKSAVLSEEATDDIWRN